LPYDAGLALTAAALGALLLAPSLLYPFGRDQSVFAYVAQTISRGGLPYRDVWDLKPPGIYALYLAILKLFGQSMPAVRAVDLCFACAAALALFVLGRRHCGPIAAAAAAVWYAAAYFRMEFWAMAQAESFAALPVVVALACWCYGWERRSPALFLTSGFLGGLAATLKFTTVLPLVVPILLALSRRTGTDGERSSLRLWSVATLLTAVGVALPLLASILWMRRVGCWDDYLVIQRGFVAGYTRLDLASLPLRGLRHTGEFALRYAPLLLLAGIGLVRLRADKGVGGSFSLGWLFAAVVTVWAQNKFFRYHWIVALPPLCLLAGVGTVWAVERLRARWRRVPVPTLALALPVFWSLAVNGAEYVAAVGHKAGKAPDRVYLTRFGRPNNGGDFSFLGDLTAAQYLLAARVPDRGVFIWGFEPLVYLLSNTRPPTRFIFAVPLVAPWAPSVWRDELMRDLRAHPPEMILVVSHDLYPWATGRRADSEALLKQFPALNNFVLQHYQFQQVIEDFIVYRKR
jgi:Dolichyl-phosphate-mannose-protein mannosyltransferase